jgi:hypothetical protein
MSFRPGESTGKNDGRLLGIFRVLALIAVITGAAGSIGLMLFAGSRQRSLVLIALFAGWVLSPFVALAWAALASRAWPARTRTTLYGLMLFLTLVSLGMYDRILPMPPGSRPAAVFLVVPLASWLFIAIAAFAGRGLVTRAAGSE